jgi:DNA-binding beta-propeller fold protein YncE
MLKRLLALLLPLLAIGFATPAVADHDGVVRFATLPKPGPGFPEGIAADHRGRIFVATFNFFDSTITNVIYVLDRHGEVDLTIPLPALDQLPVLPLGLAFDDDGKLYAADLRYGKVFRYDPPFRETSAPAHTFNVCGGMGAGCGLNAITFDKAGNLYVSDSFGGNIFKITPGGGISTFIDGSLQKFDELKPGSHGFPPFGANGLAWDAKEQNLYIANTADDRILKYNVASDTLSHFAESINGADGIAFDHKGRLWVAANQGDEVVALNDKGRIVERVGSFGGIAHDGAAKGLLFPASIVIRHGFVYVTNLALPLTGATGDEPEEDVVTYTVSRFRLPH